mmetsp:Transcript_26226/g.67449  ORF Transcript_26226/g.67449 Transcript_26226/m.67449 type:complete len:327 (-) Transcript_26226:546-1526(-)
MADVKDILGVPQKGDQQGNKPAKPVEEKAVRPKWMSREAFALLDDSHPIMPSAFGHAIGPLALKNKPKGSSRGRVTWQWQEFANQARTDGLKLSHWVKCFKDASGRMRPAYEGDYPFVKFDKKAELIIYTDEEYNNLLAAMDPRWSRAETDYLMDLCVQFDLRFNVIADRYQFQGGPRRSMEDMKARYYSLARALLIAREGGEEMVANSDIVKNPYNHAHEMDRKRQLALAWARGTGMENPEDARVLEEANSIEARQKAAADGAARSTAVIDKDKRAAAATAASAVSRPDAPAEEGIPSFFSAQGVPMKPVPNLLPCLLHCAHIPV